MACHVTILCGKSLRVVEGHSAALNPCKIAFNVRVDYKVNILALMLNTASLLYFVLVTCLLMIMQC